MTAGKRDTLIAFEHATTAQNESGEEVETWASVGQEWAAVFWGRGDERRQAAMEQGAQPATFQVPDNDVTRAVVVKDRISFNGAWDIVGIAMPRRGEIEFSAVRAA